MSTVQPSTTGTAVSATTTTPTTPAEKKGKITDRIVQELKALPEGTLLTIEDLCTKMPEVKHSILQSTLSQLVKAHRVVKVPTGKRKPGYKAP